MTSPFDGPEAGYNNGQAPIHLGDQNPTTVEGVLAQFDQQIDNELIELEARRPQDPLDIQAQIKFAREAARLLERRVLLIEIQTSINKLPILE